MVTQATNMSLSAKREYLARIHARCQRVGREFTSRILDQLQDLEAKAPFALKSFHADNGSEFLHWALYEHLTGWPLRVLFTRSRAYRKNDNAPCEQKNYTFMRQLFGHERCAQPEPVAWMNDLYAQEWSQYQNHFRPTFKPLSRAKRGSKTVRRYAPL
ncbi:MAG: hypothetical protein HY043_19710 [Verrucomicrobia bacterium]|nr:hypothetical protein [Verrucomicrobiota bacterium]